MADTEAVKGIAETLFLKSAPHALGHGKQRIKEFT
jgi:hypothetical protein